MKRPATAIVEEIREKWTRRGTLDPELVPTDRIMQRWAESVGNGLPLTEKQIERMIEVGESAPRAKVPELDDATAVKVDRIVQHMPPKYRRLVLRWYKTNAPRSTIGADLGLPKTTLYLEWRVALWYLRGHFHGVGIDC